MQLQVQPTQGVEVVEVVGLAVVMVAPTVGQVWLSFVIGINNIDHHQFEYTDQSLTS
jgi:hypothetical protein